MSNIITWSEIDSEVEEFQNGYRSGFVSIFKKYEGMETDELDEAGRIIKVTSASFGRRYGIAKTTFQRWVNEEMNPSMGRTSPPTPREREEVAVAKARAEAEAKAARELEDALARQKREEDARIAAAERKAKAEREEAVRKANAESRAKHEASERELKERMRQEKLEALARLEKQLKETASTQEFDLNSLTQAQKAEIMTLLANDPDSATNWFDAQREERKRKLAEQELKAKEAAEKRREQMEDRERRTAQAKSSEDFKHSALKAFNDLEAAAEKVKEILEEKGGVTFAHITASGRSANDWVSATELVEDVAVAIRESIFEANAFLQLQDVEAD